MNPRPWAAPATAALACRAALCLAGPLLRIGLHLELPNEGWNAVHAMRWIGGGPLYPPRGALIVNTYPPLWFLLEGMLGRWTGDPIVAGRIVAVAAFLWTAAMIAAAVFTWTRDRLAAAVGALAFVATLAGLLGDFVALAEPQMLAHALMMTAFVLALRARRRRAIAGAAVLAVAALFVKPIVVAAPLALTLWIAARRRAWLATWVASGALAAAAALVACLAAFGQDFVAGLLYPRVFSLSRWATNLALVGKAAVPVVLWLVATRPDRTLGRPGDLVVLALIGTALAELAAFGGALGVAANVAFDLVIAAALAAGLAVDPRRLAPALAAGPRRFAPALLVGLVLARVAAGLPGDLIERLAPERQGAVLAELEAVRAELASVRGPVACEALSLCLWAGHLSDIDLWKIRHERTLAPSVDAAAVAASLARGDYAAVVLFGRQDDRVAFPAVPGLTAALAAAYPQRSGGRYVTLFRR